MNPQQYRDPNRRYKLKIGPRSCGQYEAGDQVISRGTASCAGELQVNCLTGAVNHMKDDPHLWGMIDMACPLLRRCGGPHTTLAVPRIMPTGEDSSVSALCSLQRPSSSGRWKAWWQSAPEDGVKRGLEAEGMRVATRRRWHRSRLHWRASS
ncbi:hypothetical protein BO78DRAFT_37844 [Aspergillus sclerotiicarbonarius CBS 121057]|uniref:Uncharacterized protein n=1 Tax=Aspergillus sclerotiicarbonarius (strain CBS 121057 / IBT 28362) TaxID=1448318 RepID=A0A319DSI2_ASPSB|nr:hypothetical protein BO78DRAFT_37844 [Aspergillus sclerotiicarbonarius CBS 121057]